MGHVEMTAGQRAQLHELLLQRLHALQQAIAAQRGGATRAEFAEQLLSDDPDAPREHEAERELALQRADQLVDEERDIGAALLRLRDGSYGSCSACGAGIAFDRLRAQPMAARCLDCQQQSETA
jgi:RNA polymerase-binding protein DksA